MASFFRAQWKVFQKQPDALILVTLVSCAASGGVLFGIRTAMKNPDVSVARNQNPEPWNKMKQDQRYKLMKINQDLAGHKFPAERPVMDNDNYKGI